MEPFIIFWTLLAFSVASMAWHFSLELRQYTVHRDNERRPVHLAEFISEDDYIKARLYSLDKKRFGFVKMAFDNTYTVVTLLFGILPILWHKSGDWSSRMWGGGGEIWQSIMFIIVTALIDVLLSLPFKLYYTFVIEQKHGFNKETLPFFIKDRAKKFLIGLAFNIPFTVAIIFLIKYGGPHFYVYVWIFYLAVMLIMMWIYPEFIAPLFDKYMPLPECELRTKIESLAKKLDFPLKKLYVVQGSIRSAHSNAYMYGFGDNKRIVLFDTLLSPQMNQKLKEIQDKEEGRTDVKSNEDTQLGLTDDEVLAVMGHELGHWQLWHIWIMMAFEMLNHAGLLAIFKHFYREPRLYSAFGFDNEMPALIGQMIIMQYLVVLYNDVLSVLFSYGSRQCEFSADRFSAKLGLVKQQISALNKLGKDNLSLPIDDSLYAMVYFDHPTHPERIEALKKFQ